ncbi:hypothetical protein N9924_00230 [bacterium]|nr:hypothetical protein [bacterium]
MEKQKLIELLRKAYLSGIMEKELTDEMVGFNHDLEGMATHYAVTEVNNNVLDDISIIESEVCTHCGSEAIINFGIAKKCSDCRKII